MTFPNIPDVDATIDITTEEAINLLLASIAFEELGLAHIINAEAEKIQYVLGTIDGQILPETPPTIDELLEINNSVDKTLKNVIKKEMLLQFKLEDTITFSKTTTSTTTTTTTTTEEPIALGSAWSVGTRFGEGIAEYTTLESTENEKTVVLGMGATYIPVGTVYILRSGTTLFVTISTAYPYLMDLVHLYADDVVPTNSAPGSFPYKYPDPYPAGYFTTHTFSVDTSGFTGDTIYIAAHAQILQQV